MLMQVIYVFLRCTNYFNQSIFLLPIFSIKSNGYYPQFMLSLIPVFRRSDHIIGKTLATKSFDSQSCKNYQVSNSLFVYFKAKIHYYCREQYYCHMEEAAEEGLKKFSNDSVLKFYRAYAQILQGKI